MSGHGHVTPHADGSKARCGGPRICKVCAAEYAALYAVMKQAETPIDVLDPPVISGRISDERHPLDPGYLDESGAALLPQRLTSDRLWELAEIAKTSTCNEWKCMVSELQQSRALISKLRSLAERMREDLECRRSELIQPWDKWDVGSFDATVECLLQLDSLLAAHDKAQADKP